MPRNPTVRHRGALTVRAGAILAALALAAPLAPSIAAESDVSDLVSQVRAWRGAHERDVVEELAEFLALPNVASDSANIERNAQHLLAMMHRRGMKARILRVPGTPPAVFGELPAPGGAAKTVVFYCHYDGQSVDPERWEDPPWSPTLRGATLEAGGEVVSMAGPYSDEQRLYARSSSDDKSPIVAMLAAIDALAASGVKPSVNLKFFFEGEEEAGSEGLGDLLERYAADLEADAWIFADGPVHQTRRPVVVYGVRGVVGLAVSIYGPKRELHSGHYGNWAPNPALMLAELIAGMRGDEGEITIAGFYDDVAPVTEADLAAIAAAPDVGPQLAHELALGRTEGRGGRLGQRILRPALNVQGFGSGGVPQNARNAIPTVAHASFDFRLVPNQSPERVREVVEAHIAAAGYFMVREEPDDETRRSHERVARVRWESGYRAARTPVDLPLSRAVTALVDAVAGGASVQVPSYGGSLPLYLFEEHLGAPFVIVPMVNHDNNQHAANENLRLGNLWDGIEIYAALMARLGSTWAELEQGAVSE